MRALVRVGVVAGVLLGGGGYPMCARAAPTGADFTTLYDATLGTLPDAQGWSRLQLPANALATQTVAHGVAWLDSTAQVDDQAGYARLVGNEVPLDRTAGFVVRLAAEIAAEQHVGSDRNADGVDDRAGFSLLVLASDRRGVELGFWEDEVWAQEGGATEPPRFTHAESAALPPGTLELDLTIQGSRYVLRRTGQRAALLSGPVRDYTTEGPPYNVAGFVFVGDNTASAAARAGLHLVSVRAGVPRPLFVPLASTQRTGAL